MIKFIKAGIQTSVQDLGRHGHRQFGVAQSGALDANAIIQANYLLGNETSEAAIEMAIGPIEILAQSNIAITVVGGDATIALTQRGADRLTVQTGQVLSLQSGDHVAILPQGQFARCYLALQGGIEVPIVMHSRATDITAGFGGFEGRCLKKNDIIHSRLSSKLSSTSMTASNSTRFAKPEQPGHEVRVIPGPEYHCLTPSSQRQFWQSDWQLSNESNRMGCRLIDSNRNKMAGQPTLQLNEDKQFLSHSMPSHGVIPGTIQLPQQGEPIILLADCQTTGGYPRIGKVIDADLWRLAQRPKNSLFRLVECDRANAIQIQRQQKQTLYRFKLACLQHH